MIISHVSRVVQEWYKKVSSYNFIVAWLSSQLTKQVEVLFYYFCHTRLHLGFSAKQVSACKMEPQSGFMIYLVQPPVPHPYLSFSSLTQLVASSRRYVRCPSLMLCGIHITIVLIIALFATLGSILDSQLSWVSSNFQIARWSHRVPSWSTLDHLPTQVL